jgi:hypothetical protein
MVIKKASGDDFPLWQGAGKSFWTLPISGRRRRRLAVCFVEKCSSLRVFPMKGIYRRKGDVRGWTRGPHHLVAQPGGARATLWCGRHLVQLHLSSAKLPPIVGAPPCRHTMLFQAVLLSTLRHCGQRRATPLLTHFTPLHVYLTAIPYCATPLRARLVLPLSTQAQCSDPLLSYTPLLTFPSKWV